MRLFLYNLAGAGALIAAAVPVLFHRRWRTGLGERLFPGSIPVGGKGGEVRFWVHGASVGEVLAAALLVEEMAREYPRCRLLFTTFTVSGRDVARERFAHFGERIHVRLVPLDWNGLPARALNRFKPHLFILLETELWPNLLNALKRSGTPALLANGRISERSYPRYRALQFFFSPFLEALNTVCVRTGTDAERFRQIGVERGRIDVAGNIKHDRPPGGEKDRLDRLRRRLSPSQSRRYFVAGSIRRGEAKVLLRAFTLLRELFPELVLVLAPRHPERFDDTPLVESGLSWTAWSTLGVEAFPEGKEVLLVDTVGELVEFYALSELSFVGGSLFGAGGQNVLEPAACAVPVLFGPDYRNFEEEGEALVESGGGFIVATAEELAAAAERLLKDSGSREEASRQAGVTAESFRGAVGRTLSAVRDLLSGDGA